MGTIRFTAAERPGLLADAVLDATHNLDGADGLGDALDAIRELAAALKSSDGRRFDELLTEHFREQALARLGITPDPTVGVDPETRGEARVER